MFSVQPSSDQSGLDRRVAGGTSNRSMYGLPESKSVAALADFCLDLLLERPLGPQPIASQPGGLTLVLDNDPELFRGPCTDLRKIGDTGRALDATVRSFPVDRPGTGASRFDGDRLRRRNRSHLARNLL